MARLPIPGSDDGAWGAILNDFLEQVHTNTGTLKDNTIGNGQLQPGSVTEDTLAAGAVTDTSIADDSISEAKLDAATRTKLNTPAGVSSVNTRTGDVTLTKTDVGLENVDNTSDMDKPIATAVQTALDQKANASDVGAKVLLIDTEADLPAGTPAGVVVVVKS